MKTWAEKLPTKRKTTYQYSYDIPSRRFPSLFGGEVETESRCKMTIIMIFDFKSINKDDILKLSINICNILKRNRSCDYILIPHQDYSKKPVSIAIAHKAIMEYFAEISDCSITQGYEYLEKTISSKILVAGIIVISDFIFPDTPHLSPDLVKKLNVKKLPACLVSVNRNDDSLKVLHDMVEIDYPSPLTNIIISIDGAEGEVIYKKKEWLDKS